MVTRILIAVLLGAGTALLLGPDAAILGPLGASIIQLIKISATPLLFFTIVRSVLEAQLSWRLGRRVIRVALTNLFLALGIGLLFSNLFQPGAALNASLSPGTLPVVKPSPSFSLETFLQGLIPESLLTPFVKNDVLTIVLIALILGFALKQARKERGFTGSEICPEWIREILRSVEILIHWVVKIVPLAVFAAVAKSLGEYGLQPIQGLLSYLAVGLGALIFHSIVVYGFWIFRVARIHPRVFFPIAREPVVHALGVNSSLATLPLTLHALRKLGISQEASALGAGVATNVNNDGIILYEGMAVLFLAQAYGLDYNLTQQLVAAFLCVAGVLGVTGVPEAGFISLSVVVTALKMPADLLPLLLTVDWIVARVRSAVNVLADMTLSIAVDHAMKTDPALKSAVEGTVTQAQ